MNDGNVRHCKEAQHCVTALRGAFEQCIVEGTLHHGFCDMAENLWIMNEELAYWLEQVPSHILLRQTALESPPFRAPRGIPLIREAARRALGHVRALLPFSDETLATAAEILEDILQLVS